MNKPIRLIAETDPDKRIRLEWAQSLADHLEMQGVTKKQLIRELGERGVGVSRQAVDYWLAGTSSPRPYHQAVIAGILRVPVRSLFSIQAIAS